jgi:hypothetical protein
MSGMRGDGSVLIILNWAFVDFFPLILEVPAREYRCSARDTYFQTEYRMTWRTHIQVGDLRLWVRNISVLKRIMK